MIISFQGWSKIFEKCFIIRYFTINLYVTNYTLIDDELSWQALPIGVPPTDFCNQACQRHLHASHILDKFRVEIKEMVRPIHKYFMKSRPVRLSLLSVFLLPAFFFDLPFHKFNCFSNQFVECKMYILLHQSPWLVGKTTYYTW